MSLPRQIAVVAPRASMPGVRIVLEAEGLTFDAFPGGMPPIRLVEAEAVVAGEVSLDGQPVAFVAGSRSGADAAAKHCGEELELLSPTAACVVRSVDLPVRIREVLLAQGLESVDLPACSLLVEPPAGFARAVDVECGAGRHPLLAQSGQIALIGIDVGRVLVDLLTERYANVAESQQELSGPLGLAYKLIPFRLRLLVYRFAWRRIRRNALASRPFSTRFPIDPTGWLLHRLLVTAIESVAGMPLPRLARWPGASSAALCLTHDIEPRRYAYERGLPRLLDVLESEGMSATISIVAEPGFPLPGETLSRALKGGNEIISHGLRHDGLFNVGDTGTRLHDVTKSRRLLKELTGAEVNGFRTPWLQRTADMVEVLAESGVRYDSSLVDTDTSMKKAWHGTGVSYNYPFFLLSRAKAGRSANVLELPISGPQDMELVFAGFGMRLTTEALLAKLQWCRAVGGCYVVIIHAGQFGDADADMREGLLRSVLADAASDGTAWPARLGDVDAWWRRRRSLSLIDLSLEPTGITARLVNRCETEISDVWIDCGVSLEPDVVVEIDGRPARTLERGGTTMAEVGVLPAGAEVTLHVRAAARDELREA